VECLCDLGREGARGGDSDLNGVDAALGGGGGGREGGGSDPMLVDSIVTDCRNGGSVYDLMASNLMSMGRFRLSGGRLDVNGCERDISDARIVLFGSCLMAVGELCLSGPVGVNGRSCK